MSRSANTIKNSAFGLGAQIISYIMNFVCRTVFIKMLGSTYLGVGGLFQNILSVLSLAELGIGSAMTYKLYKPLADQDEMAVSRYMNFYASAYRAIGLGITAAGLCLLPFLSYLIKDINAVPNIRLIYVLYIVNAGASYLWSYQRTLFEADQKMYKVLLIQTFTNIMMNLLQMAALVLWQNYIVYFCIAIFAGLATNFLVMLKGRKEYAFLRKNKNTKLEQEEKKLLVKHVGAMMSHKVGSVVVNGTDNIIISAVLGLSTVGVYSNYSTIINMIKAILNPILNSFTASIGNLNAKETVEKSYRVFRVLYLLEYWIQGVVAICFFVLFPPFIELWIGSSYILTGGAFLVIILNYYINAMRHVVTTYNTTLGLFWNDRFKPWIEATVNLISSIILVRFFGLAGVFAGTLISTVTVCWWVEPYILYRHYFKKNVFSYYLKSIADFVFACAVAIFLQWLCGLTANFIIKLFVCFGVANLLFFARFGWTAEFKHFTAALKSNLNRRKNR